MSHEVMIRIEGGKAVGRTASDAETLDELEGGTYRAVLTTPSSRSPSQMRLFHKFCDVIAENQDHAMTGVHVKDILKFACGLFIVRQLGNGAYIRLPKSIAFDKMTSDEFNGFMDKVLPHACDLFGDELSKGAYDQMVAMLTPVRRAA